MKDKIKFLKVIGTGCVIPGACEMMESMIWNDDRRSEYARFILAFLFIGFTMKIVGEFTHEAGHALFVILLGGTVEGVYISFEWPFSLSHTVWLLEDSTNLKLALISGAGVLSDTVVTIIGQYMLWSKRIRGQLLSISVFWLSFWTYLNSIVYLVVGSIHPFGDLHDYLSVTQVPRILIGAIGLILLGIYTRTLSLILKDMLNRTFEPDWASNMVSVFWIFMHMIFVLATIVRYGLPLQPSIAAASLVLIFTISYISGRGILFLISQFKGRDEGVEPMVVVRSMPQRTAVEPMDGEKREKTGYILLFLAAFAAALATGVMINQYVSTYNLIMRTEISIEVAHVDMGLDEPVLNLTVAVVNPTHDNLTLKRVELEVKLNGKYMTQETMKTIPVVPSEDVIRFTHRVTLPLERSFTIEEAFRDDRWDWTVQGTSYVDTMFGETLLRFKCDSSVEPE